MVVNKGLGCKFGTSPAQFPAAGRTRCLGRARAICNAEAETSKEIPCEHGATRDKPKVT
jgi:hypothetical protein